MQNSMSPAFMQLEHLRLLSELRARILVDEHRALAQLLQLVGKDVGGNAVAGVLRLVVREPVMLDLLGPSGRRPAGGRQDECDQANEFRRFRHCFPRTDFLWTGVVAATATQRRARLTHIARSCTRPALACSPRTALRAAPPRGRVPWGGPAALITPPRQAGRGAGEWAPPMNSAADLRWPFAVRPLTPALGAEISGRAPGGGYCGRRLSRHLRGLPALPGPAVPAAAASARPARSRSAGNSAKSRFT